MLFFIYLFDKAMLLSDLSDKSRWMIQSTVRPVSHDAIFCEAINFVLFKSSFNCTDCQEEGQVSFSLILPKINFPCSFSSILTFLEFFF